MYQRIAMRHGAAFGRPWLRLLGLLSACVALDLAAGGCSGDGPGGIPIFDKEYKSPRLTPADVLTNLQLAYKRRNISEYAQLLADDFTFCFDPATRPENVPEC